MADFKVEVMKIDDVTKHPDADSLWIVSIRGYRCITNQQVYSKGDLVGYIPEGAVLPEELLKAMGFWKGNAGTLAGRGGDRVKAIRLRGVVSQGILYRIDQDSQRTKGPHGNTKFVNEGDDVADFLGITKYEAPVPVHMAGEMCNIGQDLTLKYDIENIQKFPHVFLDGEEVSITEKLHGTFCGIGFHTSLNNPELMKAKYSAFSKGQGQYFAFSKGLGAQGLVFKDNDANAHNIYQNVLVDNLHKLEDGIQKIKKGMGDVFDPAVEWGFIICGEIFGKGVQDLHYGMEKPTFRVFDAYFHGRNSATGKEQKSFLPFDGLVDMCEDLGFEVVPELYRGPFSMKKVEELRDGKTILNGTNVREGVVIKSMDEDSGDLMIGRRILKAVSPDYILRKGNVTEYN